MEPEWRSRAEGFWHKRICRPSLSLDSLRLECPDAYGPGIFRVGPSEEERCTPHHTVPVFPQCPQEIGLLTLPVFQGAAVSSERFSLFLPPRNVAELRDSLPLQGDLEQLDRPSPVCPPLQGTEPAALSTPEVSLESLVPLVGHLTVWKPLPSVSHWDLSEQTLVLLVFLGDDAGLRTVVFHWRLLRQSWCHGPGLMRAGPSGEERGTPHYTVPLSPQCPQEIGLLTLSVFQGAEVSSELFSQFLPPGNVSALRGSSQPLGVSKAARAAVPWWSSTSRHRASSSKYTRGQSRETGSLSRLFGSVETKAKYVSMRHAHCSTRLSRRSAATFQQGHSHAGGSRAGSGKIEQEVSNLLRKEAIEVVHPLDKESRFYSHTSLFLGRMGVVSYFRSKSTELLSHAKPWFLSQVPVLGAPCRRITLATDASLTSWGAVISGHPAHGLWSGRLSRGTSQPGDTGCVLST